jgi:arsenate reductase-like glutaredoxin family protein
MEAISLNNNFNGDLSKDAETVLKNNGIDPKTISGSDAKKILSSLKKEDAQKLNQILNNKEELNRILNSDAAKQIMKKFFSGGAK